MAAAQYFEQVQKIFIAFYQRPADPAGLKYWAERVDAAGGDINQVINAFASSPEAVALYGAIDATTDAAAIRTVIDKLYLALFNADATFDAAGKQFYVDGFMAGTFTAGTIALSVLNGAQNDDLIAVNNKVQVANEFTQQVDGRAMSNAYFGNGTSFNVTYAGDADAIAARDILKGVTFLPSTVISPSQVTEALKAQIADPTDPIIGQGGGQTFTLTTGADTGAAFTGGAGNDAFNAPVSVVIDPATGSQNNVDTMQAVDSLDGGAGVNTLNFTTKGGVGLLPLPTLKNIQIINGESLGALTIDTTPVDGVTNLNVTKAAGVISATAAATTDIKVDVKALAAGAATNAIGGKDITVKVADVTVAGNTIAVGAGTAAKGDVVVEATAKAASVVGANINMGTIAVTGGKTISVTQKAGDASGLVADGVAGGGTTTTHTQGAVTATANADTTSVTIKQDALVAAANVKAVAKVDEVATVTFAKLDSGQSATVGGLTFTAAKDLTDAQVAQAFASLSAGAVKPVVATGDTNGGSANANGVFTGALLAKWGSAAASGNTVTFTASGAMATDLTATSTGTTSATSVTTTQGVNAVVGANKLGVANGTVSIAGAAALKTVTVDGYATASGVTGAANALDTVNLSNGVDFSVANAAATLALNLTNVNGTVNVATGTKTLNAAVSHAKITDTATLVSASAETVNVSGTGNVAGSTATSTLVTAINTSAMTAGKATFTIADGTKTAYTGGAGVDSVTVSNADTAITKAINLGAGDDKLTLTGTNVKVPTATLDGGVGTNTIAMNAVSAESLSQSNAFAAKIDNFQKLEVTDTVAIARTVNMANMDGIKHVISNGAGSTGAGKQVETVTLSGDFVVGNTVSITVNALAPVVYTVVAADLAADGVSGAAGTPAQVRANVATKVVTAINTGGVPAAAVVDAAGGAGGVLTLTADVAGAAFAVTKTVTSPVAKQVETVTLNGDYIVGDKVSLTVNTLAPVEYTVVANDLTVNGDGTGGVASAAQVRINVAAKVVAAINADVSSAAVVDAAGAGGVLTLTADTAGLAFALTSSATSSATKQVETVTLTGDYAVSDTVSTQINALTAVVYTVAANDLTANGDGTGGLATAAQIRANVAAKVVAAINADAPSAAVVDAAGGAGGVLTLSADTAGTLFTVAKVATTTPAKQATSIQLTGTYATGDKVTVKVNNLTPVDYTVIADDLTVNGDGTGGVASAAQVRINVATKMVAAINADVPSAAVVDAAAGAGGALTLTADVAGAAFTVAPSTDAGSGLIVATVVTPNSSGDGDMAVVNTTPNKAAGTAAAVHTTPNKLVGDAVVVTTTANDAVGSSLLTFDKMADGGTLEMVDNATHASSGAIIKMADATGLTDSFNLVTKLSTVDSNFGTVDIAGVETLKLNAIDTLLPPADAVQTAGLTLKADKATSLTIEGSSNVNLTLDATTIKLATIDAGTLAGALTATANGAVAMTITGGSGADVLKASVGASAKADIINGGAGNDTIYAGSNGAQLTGGDGNDLFVLKAGTKESTTHSSILDFQAGDVLQLEQTGAPTAIAAFAKLGATLGINAVFSDYANAAIAQANLNGAVWFQFGANAYVVIDQGTDSTVFDNGTDSIIEIVGVSGDNLSFNSAFGTVALV